MSGSTRLSTVNCTDVCNAGQSVRPAGTLKYAAPETVRLLAPSVLQPRAQQAHAIRPDASNAADASSHHCTEPKQSAEPSMDIWGLGVVAVELLTDMDMDETVCLFAMGEQKYPWEVTSEDLESSCRSKFAEREQNVVRKLIEGCLARHRSDRVTARQVVDMLEPLVGHSEH